MLWALLAVGSAHGCQGLTAGAALGSADSTWQEQGEQGQRLVREQGRLAAAQLSAEAHCLGWAWRASATQARGSRAYDGVSTMGAPIRTGSRIVQSVLALDAMRPLWPQTELGLQAELHLTRRDIASAGLVLGYPEKFQHLQMAVGARQRWATEGGGEFQIEGWWGASPWGRLKLDLPNADASTLPLGRGRHWRALAAWQAPLADGWSWRLQAQADSISWQRGSSRALRRGEVVSGSAWQPATRQSGWDVSLGWTKAF